MYFEENPNYQFLLKDINKKGTEKKITEVNFAFLVYEVWNDEKEK